MPPCLIGDRKQYVSSMGNLWGLSLEYPELRKLVLSLAREQSADIVLIEDKASGTQLAQEMRVAGLTRVETIIPDGDKTTRMYLQTAKIEAGRVFLPQSASWLDDFRREILQFPDGRDWDQIDSVSQYLKWESPVPFDLSDALTHFFNCYLFIIQHRHQSHKMPIKGSISIPL